MQATTKAFLEAINGVDEEKFIQFAVKSKSKKDNFSLKDVVKELSCDKIDQMSEKLGIMIRKHCQILFAYKNAIDVEQNQIPVDSSQILQAAVDLAQVILDENLKLSEPFLHLIIYLNDILLDIPAILENLQNNVAHLCEKVFHLKRTDDEQLFPINTLIYLFKRTLKAKITKTDLNRVYALRSLIPKILTIKKVNKDDILDLLKKIAVSNLYNSTAKGQKILTLILILDPNYLPDIHQAIRKTISSCNNLQAECYGKAYYEAWTIAVKTKNALLKDVVEFSCIQDFITLTIDTKPRRVVDILRKILFQFAIHKKEIYVSKLLCSLFQPILWMHLKHSDALKRMHTALLFLDVFPLEDPESDIVVLDQQLNQQFLFIQDLLYDEYPIVRSAAVSSLCIAMSINWELFPEEVLRTYFKIITDDLSFDSSSADVRTAVAQGMRALLENPLTVPTLQTVLPKLKHLFHDVSESVRIAFCQVLLRIKHICAIKYFDIVPLGDLLCRLEEDESTAKLIVNLIHNSYFPKDAPILTIMGRSANIIREGPTTSRVFFRYLPHFISLPATVKFIRKAIHTIHSFVLRSIADESSGRREMTKTDSSELYSVCLACGLGDTAIVSGFMDAFIVMWLAVMPNLKKPENKNLLKQLVGEVSKSLTDLVFYYKDTEAFNSVAYLGSLLPPPSIPYLASLCFDEIQRVSNEEDHPGQCRDLVYCLCNQDQGHGILLLLRQWIETALQNPRVSPYAKRRKTGRATQRNEFEPPKHRVALDMLLFILNDSYCQQKILSTEKDKLHSFLSMIEPLKRNIEASQQKKGSAEEFGFMKDLFNVLLIIPGILNDQNFETENAMFFEDVVLWMQKTLYVLAWPDTCLNKQVTRKQTRVSSSFQNLVVDICQSFCTVVGDLACAGYPYFKAGKYMKFATKFFDTGGRSQMVLHVSKVIFKHVTLGIHMLQMEQQDSVINLVPDCFSKVVKVLCDDTFVNEIPSSCVREIQISLTQSMLALYQCSGVNEMATDIMFCFIRSILTSIHETVNECWDVAIQEKDPFTSMQLKNSCAFLLSTMFIKPKLLTCFCHNLKKYIPKCGKDPPSFIALCIILQKLKEVKSVSKNLLKEINCLTITLQNMYAEMNSAFSAVLACLPQICDVQNLDLKSIEAGKL